MVRSPDHPTHYLVPFRQPERGRILAVALGGSALVAAGFGLWSRRVVVAGDSMRPAFEPGDGLLLGPAWRIQPGHVVAVPDPRYPDRLLIKRVHSLHGDLVDVRGDNQILSTDSRHFGLVPSSALAGRVVYRYAPASRARWWPQ